MSASEKEACRGRWITPESGTVQSEPHVAAGPQQRLKCQMVLVCSLDKDWLWTRPNNMTAEQVSLRLTDEPDIFHQRDLLWFWWVAQGQKSRNVHVTLVQRHVWQHGTSSCVCMRTRTRGFRWNAVGFVPILNLWIVTVARSFTARVYSDFWHDYGWQTIPGSN